MDQDGGWGPCEFQLASRPVQEPAAEAWSPAAGLPVEYASIDMFGSCSLPPFVPQSWGGQHLVECQYSAASKPNWHAAEVTDGQNRQVTTGISSNMKFVNLQSGETKISNDGHASAVFGQVESEIEADAKMIQKKMHRYPASLQALDECYTVPRYVAIGPYHHHRVHLKKVEMVKHAAAICCVRDSGHLLEEMYSVVASAADDVRCLYDKDVMAGISYDDFRHMMFFDACFLVQFMRIYSGFQIDESLDSFLGPNRRDISHDIILLENQLPWKVVEVVMRFTPVFLERFISTWKGYLQHNRKPKEEDAYVLTLVKDKRFKPHLLGLLRYYTVGRITDTTEKPKPTKPSFSISAIELAKIGITVTANKTMELTDMGLNQKITLLAELSLAPLSLDRNRATYLLNMAALELCTVKSFGKAPVEDSVVCTYVLLLALMVSRVEDVRELRARGLLQGGGGLTDKEAFKFFTAFQGLRFGRCYNRVMRDIEIYKQSRQIPTKLYAFYYAHKKIIATVLGAIVAVSGIIGTLLSIKSSV